MREKLENNQEKNEESKTESPELTEEEIKEMTEPTQSIDELRDVLRGIEKVPGTTTDFSGAEIADEAIPEACENAEHYLNEEGVFSGTKLYDAKIERPIDLFNRITRTAGLREKVKNLFLKEAKQKAQTKETSEIDMDEIAGA